MSKGGRRLGYRPFYQLRRLRVHKPIPPKVTKATIEEGSGTEFDKVLNLSNDELVIDS